MSNDNIIKKMIKAAIGDNAFVNMVSGLGTSRDKQSAGQYLPVKRMGVKDLNNIYHSDPVAKRIILKPASDAISGGWYYSKLDEEQNSAITALSKDLKIKKVLFKALSLSRLHGWSYILVGASGDDELSDPLDIGANQLSFFTVLKRDELKPQKETGYQSADITKGRYKEPEFYQMGDGYGSKPIHNSRIIRIDAPDPITGDDDLPYPVLQHVYETLKRHVSATTNAGSLIYEAKTDIIKVKNLMKNLSVSPAATITGMIQRMTSLATLKGNNGMLVLDVEEEYDSKHFAFGGLSDLIREFRVETAGAAEIPYALLFGQSAAGLNATGEFDMQSYFGSVGTMQENVLRDPIEALIDLMLQSLGIDIADIGLTFEPIYKLDAKTRAEVEKSNADRDEIYLNRAIVTEAQVAQQLVDDGTYTTIDAEYIELLKSMTGDISDDSGIDL